MDCIKPQAEHLLTRDGEDGSFLTRPSRSDPGHFVLSVRHKDTIKHFKIRCDTETYDLFGEKFANLSELVSYCRDMTKELREYHLKQSIKLGKALVTDDHITEGYYDDCMLGRKTHELNYGHVLLKYPRNVTSFHPSEIQRRKSELEKQTDDMEDGFAEEFQILLCSDNTTPYSRDEGRKECNKSKNRYKNILPYDYTRVILTNGDSSVEGSDYINANYITEENVTPWFSSECADTTKYIATQGCLENTVVDLWRMIWQENSRVIVMTTKEVERGKKQCARYWPKENEPNTFDFFNGKLTVELLNEEDKQRYVIRKLQANFTDSANHTRQSRDIYQYHYKAWPDHGVPDNPGTAIEFLQDINKKQNDIPQAGPIIIHSSAGIGRTGTFIVIDTILRQIEKNGLDTDIDILNTVRKVRQQRSGLVPTVSLYKFVYCAIAHYLEARSKRQDNIQSKYANASSVRGFRSSGKAVPTQERSQQEAGNLVYQNFGMLLNIGASNDMSTA